MNFDHLTIADLAGVTDSAHVFAQPACFVDRPHGLDGRVSRIGNSLVWFAAWHLRIAAPGERPREMLVAIDGIEPVLDALPAALAQDVRGQMAAVEAARRPLQLGERVVRLDEPQIMGILNVTPDSFSDGGKHVDVAAAVSAGVAMAAAGAAIIDVGGESTRPGAPLVWEGDEIQRVVPVVEGLVRAGVAVSVDTRKAAVMEAAIAAGAGMINDIAALAYDEHALSVAAKSGVPVVLMHAPSQTSNPHAGGEAYVDTLTDVFDWLRKRVDQVAAGGVPRENILIDPGFGFGKGVRGDLDMHNGLALFHALGLPLLVGASRKRMIGALDGEAPADQRLGGSVALHLMAAQKGANILRVHDVAETRQAVRMWRATRDAALTLV